MLLCVVLKDREDGKSGLVLLPKGHPLAGDSSQMFMEGQEDDVDEEEGVSSGRHRSQVHVGSWFDKNASLTSSSIFPKLLSFWLEGTECLCLHFENTSDV